MSCKQVLCVNLTFSPSTCVMATDEQKLPQEIGIGVLGETWNITYIDRGKVVAAQHEQKYIVIHRNCLLFSPKKVVVWI